MFFVAERRGVFGQEQRGGETSAGARYARPDAIARFARGSEGCCRNGRELSALSPTGRVRFCGFLGIFMRLQSGEERGTTAGSDGGQNEFSCPQGVPGAACAAVLLRGRCCGGRLALAPCPRAGEGRPILRRPRSLLG